MIGTGGLWVTYFVKVNILCSCTICLAEFAVGDVLTLLPCNHTFHNECVNSWLGRNATWYVHARSLDLLFTNCVARPAVEESLERAEGWWC